MFSCSTERLMHMNYTPYLSSEIYENIDLSALPDNGVIRMTNDYLFRALLQENNHVLKSLVCALLHLDENVVSKVEITNPILLGKSISRKEIILDVKVMVDDKQIADIELQVVNYGNWEERSLSYLSRAFDNVNRGRDYSEAIPVTQIGILDYTPKPALPMFYYSNSFRCDMNPEVVYSDKMRVVVLDLTRIAQATETDKAYHLDKWAQLFKATTWKELKAMVSQSAVFSEAVRTIAGLAYDEQIMEQYRAAEEYIIHERSQQNRIDNLEDKLAKKDSELADKDRRLADKDRDLTDMGRKLADKDRDLTDMGRKLADKDRDLADMGRDLADAKALIAELERKLAAQSQS